MTVGVGAVMGGDVKLVGDRRERGGKGSGAERKNIKSKIDNLFLNYFL